MNLSNQIILFQLKQNINEMNMTEFQKVINDFVADLKETFPEYSLLIDKGCADQDKVFAHCQQKFPPRFFDILYKKEDIFADSADTEFLPLIHFNNIWSSDISDNTREIIWKYFQLILFSVVGSLENKELFGDTAKLFETINESEFKEKLEETFANMQDMFDKGDDKAKIPNAEDIHGHISGMLDGKLGMLAKEIAEETANDLNLDMENVTDMKGVFNSLVKNPDKLMGLVKNVGNKLDSRIKSGELKESELISEATDIMNRMKDMPGMDNIQSLIAKMGLGGHGQKVNTAAMEAQLERKLKAAKTKERILAKAEMNRKAREKEAINKQVAVSMPLIDTTESDKALIAMFGEPEKKIKKKGKK
jgi:hypothetical protein